MGDVGRLLLVEVDPGIELLHHLFGQALLNEFDRLGVVLAGLVDRLLLGQEDHVAGRQHALVVLEDRVLVVTGAELGVGGEHDREVGLALVEHRVAEADVNRRERLEVQPVVLLEAEQAVDPLAALGRAVELQVLALAFEVGDLGHAQLLGLGGQHADRIGAGERGRGEGRDPILGQVLLGHLVGAVHVTGDLLRRGVEEGG